MRSTFKFWEFTPEIFTFPGGELHVKVPAVQADHRKDMRIEARIVDSDGILALCLLVDAVRAEYKLKYLALDLMYIPYARQDRRCGKGEAFSLKVFTNILNSLELDQVCVLDPHSDVAPSLINNCVVIDSPYKSVCPEFFEAPNTVLVAPDAGATKRTAQFAKDVRNYNPIVQGLKVRDPETGKLTGFQAFGDVEGGDMLIVDDICDGGGTFVGLAKVLKDMGANTVSLCVSHGIFSQGLERFDGIIDAIYTTDSLPQAQYANTEEYHRPYEVINL